MAKGPEILGYHLLLVLKLLFEQIFCIGARSFKQEMMSHLINLFSFLPTDPTSFLWCCVEQGINLAWPKRYSVSRVLSSGEGRGEVPSPPPPNFASDSTYHIQCKTCFF